MKTDKVALPADMAHEMGHGGKDLPAMVLDTRNRFWICLTFTVPIFVYDPMGGVFKPPSPPFGLELNLWLFFFASAEVEVPTAEVLVGETVVIRPGGKIPVDGTVETGESLVNESMLTGESMPVQKGPGATVIGATINKSSSFRYKATKVGADSALAQIVKLVQEAQNSKAPAQLLADKAAQWLVIAAIVMGLATFAAWFWWVGQSLLSAVTLTITVFMIACPDAFGLATPMAVMVSTLTWRKCTPLFEPSSRNNESLPSHSFGGFQCACPPPESPNPPLREGDSRWAPPSPAPFLIPSTLIGTDA